MSIQSVLKTYEKALNGNDTETIMGLYGANPIFMPQNSEALVGRAAVRKGYENVFATLKLNVVFDIHEVQEQGEWAWVRTSSKGRTRLLGPKLDVEEGNNELFVFRREDGDWKIHRYLFATSRPRE